MRQNELMDSRDKYRTLELENLAAALANGHSDPVNLRTLLICTTSKTTVEAAEGYFAQHHNNSALLDSLVAIALEGEDAGDAPWAAANVLADFPSIMLKKHEAALTELAAHPWAYLNIPGQKALQKSRTNDA